MTWFCSWLSDVQADGLTRVEMLERFCTGPELGSQVRDGNKKRLRSGASYDQSPDNSSGRRSTEEMGKDHRGTGEG